MNELTREAIHGGYTLQEEAEIVLHSIHNCEHSTRQVIHDEYTLQEEAVIVLHSIHNCERFNAPVKTRRLCFTGRGRDRTSQYP